MANLDDLPDGAVVLYAPPDQLLAAGDGQLDAGELLAGYRQLLTCSQRLISVWRIQACSTDQLHQGAPTPLELPAAWPQPEALNALITRQLLDATPGLLDAYLDLELKADLLGGEPDVHYRKRLLADLDPEALLAAWREPQALRKQLSESQQQLTAAQQELGEAREEAELTLLQLHQVQEELEHYFLKHREQSSELEALQQRQGELQVQCDQLQTQLQEREQSFEQQLGESQQQLTVAQQQLTSAQQELGEAREEAELTLLQLHQVQEELEHYFLLSRSQASQLERYDQLLRRGEGLLSRALSPLPVG